MAFAIAQQKGPWSAVPAALYAFFAERPLGLLAMVVLVVRLLKQAQPFPESGGRVKAIRTAEEWKAAKAGKRPFIVDFYATWCPPCRVAAPVFGELSLAHAEFDFYKVDVDAMKPIAAECGVQAMPTFKLFKKGVEAREVRGWNRAAIEAMLAK